MEMHGDLLHARFVLLSYFLRTNPWDHCTVAIEQRVRLRDHFCHTLKYRNCYVFLQLAVLWQSLSQKDAVSEHFIVSDRSRTSRWVHVWITEQGLSDILTVLQGKEDTFRMLLHHFKYKSEGTLCFLHFYFLNCRKCQSQNKQVHVWWGIYTKKLHSSCSAFWRLG